MKTLQNSVMRNFFGLALKYHTLRPFALTVNIGNVQVKPIVKIRTIFKINQNATLITGRSKQRYWHASSRLVNQGCGLIFRMWPVNCIPLVTEVPVVSFSQRHAQAWTTRIDYTAPRSWSFISEHVCDELGRRVQQRQPRKEPAATQSWSDWWLGTYSSANDSKCPCGGDVACIAANGGHTRYWHLWFFCFGVPPLEGL